LLQKGKKTAHSQNVVAHWKEQFGQENVSGVEVL